MPPALLCILLVAAAGVAHAQQVMRCVDAQGRVRYVDSAMQGTMNCRPVSGEASVVSPQAAPQTQGNPQRDANERQRAAEMEAERAAKIAAAEGRLAEARRELAEQEGQRLGGEKNYARVQERLQPYREKIERAERELRDLRQGENPNRN